jgi:hypothetical protein
MQTINRVGQKWVFQEALGYIIGTIIQETPMMITLGEDAVWARDLGNMSEFNRTGNAVEVHPVPYLEIERHALRYKWPHASSRKEHAAAIAKACKGEGI